MKAEFGGKTAAAAFAAGNCSSSGNALKISLARRVSSAGDGAPAGRAELKSGPDGQPGDSGIPSEAVVGSLVLMVLAYVYVFEQGDCIVGEHGRGAVQRYEV